MEQASGMFDNFKITEHQATCAMQAQALALPLMLEVAVRVPAASMSCVIVSHHPIACLASH
eukprot:6279165-Amphidinium_carterae.1